MRKKRYSFTKRILLPVLLGLLFALPAEGAEGTETESTISVESDVEEMPPVIPTIRITPTPAPIPEEDIIEDAEAPITVDWDAWLSQNPDIIGWLYVDAMPSISYPILYSGDDDFYLHRNYLRQDAFKGSIFLEGLNRPDFADPNSLIYGHNMADGTMFGSLKFIASQATYDADPYFWILTPERNYRYKIFAEFFTPVTSDVYLLYAWHGPEFLAWQKRWRAASEVRVSVPLTEQDRTITLTTCTSDSTKRFVVFGKCVSSRKPIHSRYQYEGAELANSRPAEAESQDDAGFEELEYDDAEYDEAEEIWD